MPPDSPTAASPAPDIPTSTPPGLIALFVAFAKISLAGFGGVLVWARRAIVDQHRWMTADEFNETYALCRVLRGGRLADFGRFPDDDAVGQKTRFGRTCRHGRGVYRHRPATAAVAGGAAGGYSALYRQPPRPTPSPYTTLFHPNPI